MIDVKNSRPFIEKNENTTHTFTKGASKWRLAFDNVIFFTLLHIGSVYGFYLFITKAKWQTWVFVYILHKISAVGVTAGAHRLWSHRAYKAKLPLKIILLVFFTISFEGSVYKWVREHRVHHKHCDTDADPHNSTRGFFFSHIGWLLLKKHPDVAAKGRNIDLCDVRNDKLLNFQKKYYNFLVLLLCFIIPTYVPLVWGEGIWTAFFVAAMLRYTLSLHAILLTNSAAHMWGTKPYAKEIRPVETKIVSFLASGEGFHNFHHTFPWDYKAAELGGYALNTSRLFIDIMAKIGWAYDLRTVSKDMIEKRVKRTGDGSHPAYKHNQTPY